jgi:small subunit ribosomal protein S6
MKVYESGIILDPQLEESTIDKQIEQVESMIKDNRGKVLEVNRWGMRRLAYEINKKQQGFYVFFVFEGDSQIPRRLEQAYVLNDSIIRFITVLADWYEPKPDSEEHRGKRSMDRDSGADSRSSLG